MVSDNDTGWVEPDITVNGYALTFAQAMAVRVAVSSFRLFLGEPSHRRQLGEGLADGYDHHLVAVETLMRASETRR